ncbi:MAG: hypothetical protein RMI89_03965 [Gloeomargarita sp. SKYBB_i_bin120]|nr:hypothetical protein [Gloeomargarita sp. SKYG98]MCS7292113.1 hypothetical protein [Gloeomargarita sp. SKYB120]MDW8177674.1 hypothetical protein [Gloeomargarita sp. SKYBB_i_bin120]
MPKLTVIPILAAVNPPEPPPEDTWLPLISLVASLVQGIIFLLGFTFSGLVVILQWFAALLTLGLGFIWTPLQAILTAILMPFFTIGLGLLLPLLLLGLVVALVTRR